MWPLLLSSFDACFAHMQAKYEDALRLVPEGAKKQRAVYHANLAACNLRSKHFEDAVQDSNAALELEPEYVKALLRRAAAYEELDDLEHALADNQKACSLQDTAELSKPWLTISCKEILAAIELLSAHGALIPLGTCADKGAGSRQRLCCKECAEAHPHSQ